MLTLHPNSIALFCDLSQLCLQVAILRKLRAENVVRFLGVCANGEQTMLVRLATRSGLNAGALRHSACQPLLRSEGRS